MEYRNLVDRGADRTELQAFLTQGEMVTTTVRIPANLKQTIAEEAALQGASFSTLMRRFAIQCLSENQSR